MRGSRSLAVFTIRKEEDKQRQLENYFKHSITIGIIALVLVIVGLSLPLSLLLLRHTGTTGLIVGAAGLVGIFLGAPFAGVMIVTTRRITKDTDLDLTEEQKATTRRSLLLYRAAIAIVFITLFVGVPVGVLIHR